MRLIEDEGGWRITFSDGYVNFLHIDYRLGVSLVDEPEHANLTIETEFTLREGANDIHIEPSDTMTLGPALRLFMKKVAFIDIRRDGNLEIQFEGDLNLEVEPAIVYESWEITCPMGSFACYVGGDVTFNSTSGTH